MHRFPLTLGLYFLEQFQVYSSRESPRAPCPHTCSFAHHRRPPHGHATFTESVADVRAHSWCCAFYRFRQTQNDTCPLLRYHPESFTALNILPAPPMHPSPHLALPTLILLLSPQLCPLQDVTELAPHIMCSLSTLASSTYAVHFKFLHGSSRLHTSFLFSAE